MRILVQWTQRTPRDWIELDGSAWADLPKKAEPVGGDAVDDAPGWVFDLNVQGVLFGGNDHYAVEELGDGSGGIRVTVWNDDPDDFLEGWKYARVWTIHPLAPDSGLGGTLNTRQSQVVFAQAEMFTLLSETPTENFELRPWSEFVTPEDRVTRHGIWISEVLSGRHLTKRGAHAWMEWGGNQDNLPAGSPRGSVRFLFNAPDTGNNDCGFAVDFNRKMDEAGQTVQTLSASVAAGASKVSHSFVTVTGDPNSDDWPAASPADPYRCSFNVSEAGADLTFGLLLIGGASGRFSRLSSACINREFWTQEEPAFSGTGIKVANNTTRDPGPGFTDDRYECRIAVRNVNTHMAQTFGILTDANSFGQGPWTVPRTRARLGEARLGTARLGEPA